MYKDKVGNLFFADLPASEAELVPGCDHATTEIETVIRGLGEGDHEITVLCRYSGRVIPLVITGAPVVKIDSLPERIVARVEASSVLIELVTKYESHLLAVNTHPRARFDRRIYVDDIGPQSWDLGHLTSGIDSAKVEASRRAGSFLQKEDEDWIAASPESCVSGHNL